MDKKQILELEKQNAQLAQTQQDHITPQEDPGLGITPEPITPPPAAPFSANDFISFWPASVSMYVAFGCLIAGAVFGYGCYRYKMEPLELLSKLFGPTPPPAGPTPPKAFFPVPHQTGFQYDSASLMSGIIDLHHDIMTFLVFIIIFVIFFFGVILYFFAKKRTKVLYQFFSKEGVTHHTQLETIWTVVPTLILLFIATPSFALIYALDEVVEPQLTVRVVGHQWYWTYEFPDEVSLAWTFDAHFPKFFKPLLRQLLLGANERELLTTSGLKKETEATSVPALEHYFTQIGVAILRWRQAVMHNKLTVTYPGFTLNSYLMPTEDLVPGSFRLLEVTRRLVLPVQTNVRLLITSYDVLHSWAVPAFGAKVDAVTGRLNEYFLNIHHLGIFYGQCSEICGVNHGFMPIKVETVSLEQFKWWFALTSLLENPNSSFRHSCKGFDSFPASACLTTLPQRVMSVKKFVGNILTTFGHDIPTLKVLAPVLSKKVVGTQEQAMAYFRNVIFKKVEVK